MLGKAFLNSDKKREVSDGAEYVEKHKSENKIQIIS
jgi:hypothetical protein